MTTFEKCKAIVENAVIYGMMYNVFNHSIILNGNDIKKNANSNETLESFIIRGHEGIFTRMLKQLTDDEKEALLQSCTTTKALKDVFASFSNNERKLYLLSTNLAKQPLLSLNSNEKSELMKTVIHSTEERPKELSDQELIRRFIQRQKENMKEARKTEIKFYR